MGKLCENRVCIVTGAGRGIGREYALMLAEHGAKVVVNDLGGARDGIGSLARARRKRSWTEIRRGGRRSDRERRRRERLRAAKAMIQQAIATFGRLDVLVNNAGILRDRMLVNMTEAEWDAVIKVHLKGTFAPAHHAAALLARSSKAGRPVDARIINTTSVSGIYGNPGQTNYGAAKAGIAASPSSRRASSSATASPSTASRPARSRDSPKTWWWARSARRSARMHPRWVAPIVTWLASRESAHVTGRVFEASGRTLAVAEGWHRGPSAAPVEDPTTLGPIVRSLVERAASQRRHGRSGSRRRPRLRPRAPSASPTMRGAMLRPLAERADGYRLLEIGSIDDLDLATFLPMLDRAWRADYAGEPRLDFDEAVLRKLTPGSSWVGVVAVAPDGSPVGFELALERTLRAAGKTFRCFYASVFTVAADHRRRGLGRFILEGINRLVFDQREADLILSTFHEGHAGSPAVQSTFDLIPGWGVVRFHRSQIWSRRLDRNPLPALERVPTYVELEMTAGGPDSGVTARDHGVAAPDAGTIDARLRASFSASFALSASLAAQYLNPRNAASGMILYEPGAPGFGLVGWNVLPMAIDDRRLRPIGQLQLLLAPERSAATVETLVLHTAHRFAERGCFAMTLLDLGVVPRPLLESLGFAPTDTHITFAVRGPERNLEAFADLHPPFFLDFT